MDAHALGRYLRETREAKERTLEDAEHSLRIRRRILEAFERGELEFSDLSVVQVRGFVRNYARYLGLDEDKVVGYYEAALQELHNPKKKPRRARKKQQQAIAEPPAPPKVSTREVPVAARSITDTDPSLPAVPTHLSLEDSIAIRRRRRMSTLNRTVLFLVALAAISVIVFVSVELLSVPAAAIDVESLPDIIVTETSTPTFTPLPTSTSVQAAFAPTERTYLAHTYDGTGVMVSVLTQQRTWVRFVVDGEERFVGTVPPDSELEAKGFDQIEVSASNAEALLVTYNGQPQRLLGARGQRVDVIFTPTNIEISGGGDFQPTSEFSPTPPPTSEVDVGSLIEAQTPSSTPGPSPTPSLTFTPSLTPPPSNTPTQTPIPTDPPTITPTVGPSPTQTATATVTLTSTASLTPEPSITPTPSAVLPLRITPTGQTPTKPGS